MVLLTEPASTYTTIPTGPSRRARVWAIVLIVSARMVMFTTSTTSTVSCFPTGAFNSPGTDFGNGVWLVRPDGSIDYYVNIDYYSYGSPDTSYDYILDNRNFVIEWDGSIDGLNDPDDSYG